MTRARLLAVIFAIGLALSVVGNARTPLPLPAFTPWDRSALEKTPALRWVDEAAPVRSLLYVGEPYEGHPTHVFAYYASPVTLGLAKAGEKKYPGLVLVHGGGGAAFAEWAELYARRGYAAIAMDLSGNWAPTHGKVEELRDGGPKQDDATKFRTDIPDKDAWTYHAVADVLLAHSLLRSFPEVDIEQTGVTGISWGGYLTCIVAGIDGRFKAACPQYGCGFLGDNSYWVGPNFKAMKPADREHWLRLWDPASYVGSAPMPMFFANGSNDFAYPLDSYMKTYALVPGAKNIRIQPAMPHGHIFDVKEVMMFFDSVFKGGTPLARVVHLENEGGQIKAEVESALPLKSATLQFTKAPHVENLTRVWVSRPLTIEGKLLRGEAPPDDATAWYLTVTDERDALVSSEVRVR